jgi:hypothetical protein
VSRRKKRTTRLKASLKKAMQYESMVSSALR